MPTIGQSPLPICTESPMLACSNRLLIELLTTTSRCPGVNHRPCVILICGRISIPRGDRKRVVTLVSPVPPLRGSTTTRMSSPETRGSPLAFLATPGRSFKTCMASRETPPAASSESEPLRSINTFSGSPVVAKARPRPGQQRHDEHGRRHRERDPERGHDGQALPQPQIAHVVTKRDCHLLFLQAALEVFLREPSCP